MSTRGSMHHKTLRTMLAILAATIVLLALPASALGIVPSGVSAGTDSIGVTWVAEPDTGYFVWRSIEATSAEARALGYIVGGSFTDLTAVYGGKYYYAVAKPGELPTEWTSNSVSLATTEVPSPHVLATSTSETCAQCHALHGPTFDDASVLADLGQTDKSVSGLCLVCHETNVGGTTSSVGDAFNLDAGSGHTLGDGGADLQCSSCHDVHDQTTSNGSLTPDVVKNGGVESTVSPSTNGWCVACHATASATAVDATDIVSIDNGYPLSGAYLGQSTYEDTSTNVHASLEPTGTSTDIGRQKGDCLHCHASHRSASPYGGLLVVGDVGAELEGRFVGDDAPLCVTCHPDAGDASGTAGHAVKTAGGAKEYPVGTPMPCFACHNAHGSSRGNALNISDTLGQNLNPAASDAQERQFCFTCHTSDGYGWNSVEGTGTYTLVATSAGITLKSVLGLSRVDSANVLSLESRIPDHGYLGTRACSDCHFSSHNPEVSLSEEVTSCVDCHTELGGMDASSVEASETYHHVLGAADGSLVGGSLFLEKADPVSSTDTMYCVTCHTNHIKYPNTEGTLRASVTSTQSATSEVGTSETSPGLCISCHKTILSRNNTAQRSSTEPTVAAIGYTAYYASGHSYSFLYKGDATSANCVKCHNSADAYSVPTNLIFFGLHTSSNSSLIARLGANDSDPQALCFQCHAQIGQVAAPIGKTEADRDWYNAASMSPTTTVYLSGEGTTFGTIPHDPEMVFADVGSAASGHFKAVCSTCHDTHAENSKSASLAGSDWPLTKRPLPTQQSVIPTSVVDADDNRPIFLADVPVGTAPTWITCFAGGCHPDYPKDENSATVHTTEDHSVNPVACVDCHVPHIHGEASLAKQNLPAHQVMTWYDPLSGIVKPVADLYTFEPSPDVLVKESCTTNQANCHKQTP